MLLFFLLYRVAFSVATFKGLFQNPEDKSVNGYWINGLFHKNDKPLRCVIVNDPNLWLYNGMAFVGDDERKMKVLHKILESRIFGIM